MRKRITFFLIATGAVAAVHYLLVQGLTHLITSGSAAPKAIVLPVLWLLTAPMNFLLSSSFGGKLSPIQFQLFFTANSLLWGLASGVAIVRRWKHE